MDRQTVPFHNTTVFIQNGRIKSNNLCFIYRCRSTYVKDACLMLKPNICLLSTWHGLGPLITPFTIEHVCAYVCKNDDE